jgi:hypothetical protein
MRLLIASVSTISLTACVTYTETFFLRPSGPGDTVKERGVPRIQRVGLGAAGYVDIRADRQAAGDEVVLYVRLESGHFASFTSPTVGLVCERSAPIAKGLSELRAHRVRDGVGYMTTFGVTDKMVGSEVVGPDRSRGDKAAGSYWVTAEVSCAGRQFDIRAPNVVLDGKAVELGTIHFAPDHGRFVNVPPIA